MEPVQKLNSPKVDPNPLRKPEWLRVKPFGGQNYHHVNGILKSLNLNTVCHEASCPNRGECFNRGTAVFLLLGPNCTRNCRFCDVTNAPVSPLDPTEPARVAEAVQQLKLRYVVITSVTRDDLSDGGAEHFAATVRAIRQSAKVCSIELLIPDFRGSREALATVMHEHPEILNHNLETVPRLYPTVRPAANYTRSLNLLKEAHELHGAMTKSGLMVGLGETAGELRQVFADLASNHVSILTMGQYLAPSRDHLAVVRYVTPLEFQEFELDARKAGIPTVFSGPLVRSSYMADTIAPQ